MSLIQISAIVLIAAIAGCQAISLETERMRELINRRCFNTSSISYGQPLINGQEQPIGNSIENLIALIEKFEVRRPDIDARTLVVMLLKRFHYDGLKVRPSGDNEGTSIENEHRKITRQMFGDISTPDFPEDVYTESEKCALFYMISHTINETARFDDRKEDIYDRPIQIARAPPQGADRQPNVGLSMNVGVKPPAQSAFLPKPVVQTKMVAEKNDKAEIAKTAAVTKDKQTPDKTNEARPKRQVDNYFDPKLGYNKNTKYPREQGVVSFRNDRMQAIAINRVLLGAAIGLTNTGTKPTVHALLKKLESEANLINVVDSEIDPKLAVTLSDLLAIDGDTGMSFQAGPQYFGATGKWNTSHREPGSTAETRSPAPCTTTYRLETNATLATLAEIRGGVDGFNLARSINEVYTKNPKMTLSQILRWYYSPRGLTSDSGYCLREYGLAELTNSLIVEARAYIRIWNVVKHDKAFDEQKLSGYIEESWQQFDKHLRFAMDKSGDDRIYCTPPASTDIKTADCETPADVIFLLDCMGRKDEQMELVTSTVRQLDLRRHGGAVTVLVNSEGTGFGPIITDEFNRPVSVPLTPLTYNTTSAHCASCQVSWWDNRTSMAITDRPKLLELINKTLMEYELRRADWAGVPSKSLVWFNYDNLKIIPTDREQRRRYDDYKWRLRYEHRDVPYFLLTPNREPIKDLIRQEDHHIQVGQPSIEDIRLKGEQLAKKICEIPATFQHTECRLRRSKEKTYDGYITPGFKQYWAMYPEFFIKSYNIELKFSAANTKIKVCFDRYAKPERDQNKCQEAKEDGGEVRFSVVNPCEGRTFENCEPFYFAIGLSHQTATTINCVDPKCKSLDQVKFTFTHTGVACSSAFNLVASRLIQIMAVITLFVFFKRV